MMGVFVQLNEKSKYRNHWPVGYVIQENGCWEWVGCILSDGYAQWRQNGRKVKPHRVLYERHKGPIPKGLHLDHLCRNRACVNPDHLEAVTCYTNVVVRGRGPTAANKAKTHCVNGHEFTSANTIPIQNGGRRCRNCQNAIKRNRRRNGSP